MRIIKNYFILLSASFLVLACSKHDNTAHLDNALDLSGSYEVSRGKGSEVDMEIKVSNQGNRNNVSVLANRTSPFTSKERIFINSKNISSQKVFDHFSGKPIEMTANSKNNNVSPDAGNSSQFYVCSKDYSINSASVRYCISGILSKETNTMGGKLILQIDKDKQTSEVGLSFNSQSSKAFDNQYIGKWYGPVYRDSADFDPSVFTSIEVQKDETLKTYIAIPNPKEITYRGDKYLYIEQESQRPIQAFSEEAVPSIYIVYRGQGNNRITIQAQIWSLGDMKGSIEYLGRRSNDSLGYFQFKKK